jgi:hypothetical protein
MKADHTDPAPSAPTGGPALKLLVLEDGASISRVHPVPAAPPALPPGGAGGDSVGVFLRAAPDPPADASLSDPPATL